MYKLLKTIIYYKRESLLEPLLWKGFVPYRPYHIPSDCYFQNYPRGISDKLEPLALLFLDTHCHNHILQIRRNSDNTIEPERQISGFLAILLARNLVFGIVGIEYCEGTTYRLRSRGLNVPAVFVCSGRFISCKVEPPGRYRAADDRVGRHTPARPLDYLNII